MFKKIISFALSLTLLFTASPFKSEAHSQIEYMDNIPTVMINQYGLSEDNISSIIPLYNVDDTIIAYSIEGFGNYTIVDLNGMIIVQCEESNSPFYNLSNRVYINGPLSYFVKKDDLYMSVFNDNQTVTAEAFSNNIIVEKQKELADEFAIYNEQYMDYINSDNDIASNDVDEENDNSETIINNTLSNRSYTDTMLAYAPRQYFYNPSGICMGTAGATLLAYYYDHIDSNIAAPRHINSDGVGLTILLADTSYYYYTSGSAAERAAQSLNWYISNNASSSRTATYSDTASNFFSTIVSKIQSGEPLQAHFNDTNINHSVFVRGYRTDTSNPNNNGIKCSYGWDSTNMNVFVNISYVYGLIYFN